MKHKNFSLSKVTSVDFKGEGSPKIGDSRRGDRAAGGKKKASEKKKDSGMIAVYQKKSRAARRAARAGEKPPRGP